MKFLKECDCCQKELGTTKPCSVLVPLTAMAQGLCESRCKAGGHRPARKWILHTVRIIAQFSAVRLNLRSTNCASWNRQHGFVSGCFLLSRCKQAVLWAVSLPLSARRRSHRQTSSAGWELKLKLPLPDSSPHAGWKWKRRATLEWQSFSSF